MTKNNLFSGLLGLSLCISVPYFPAYAQVTPQQIAQIKNVGSSIISDNGQYVAYTLIVPTDPKKENTGSQVHLYVLNVASNEAKAYHSSSSVGQISFRPAKGTITFLSKAKDDKINSLYELSLNGGEAQKIVTHTASIATYSWSSDGQKLAFVSADKAVKPKTPLTFSPTFFEEEFSTRNAYIINDLAQADKAEKLNLKEGSAYMINWSPDATKLAVSVAPTTSVDDSYMNQKIKIVNATTKEIIATIDNEGKLGEFVWSPDSKNLALVAAFDLHDPTNGSILIASASGGKPQVIDGNFKGKYESIVWQDANTIHFLASEGTQSTMGSLQSNGTNKQYLYKTATQAISSFTRAKNGVISFTASSPEHAAELFTIAKKNASAIRRTHSNAWLDGLILGRQEVITYKARDGKYDIEGMLLYPIDYKEGTSYPLITVVHGGPESHYSNGWLTAYSMPGQMACAKGYAVFYPNYRGSTGRGTDFTYSSQSDMAGKEFDDIVDGVDYLIGKGIADKKRIGVTGGSYGGYASAWMSTYYSDRFAAAVMFVGISNNISKFGTSDIPSEMYLVHERENIWDNWQKNLERSPIYHVGKSQTPILIMHGAEDPRVHPAQSMELYRHIKVRKPELPLRLIYYPGEGHGNARSGSRYDYNLRMMQWFDTYLKSGDAKAAMPDLDLPE